MRLPVRALFCLSFFFFFFAAARGGELFPMRGPTIPGRWARLRRGVAYAPSSAPLAVKRAIWAANALRGKPYRFGGGHASFFDFGYDCSGTVSYALAAAGLIRTPMSSDELVRYGDRGPGKWITVYARDGHAFAVIAGLRLDTTAWNRWRTPDAPGWQPTFRPPIGFVSRHPIGF